MFDYLQYFSAFSGDVKLRSGSYLPRGILLPFWQKEGVLHPI
jgi:hypothetical protein